MSNFPIYSMNFKEKIQPGLVTTGNYLSRKTKPNLTFVTVSNKILIHDLEQEDIKKEQSIFEKDQSNKVTILNMNQLVTSLCCGQLSDNKDVLVVCTKTRVFVYDVENNKDLFHRELNDGCNVCICGEINNQKLVLVGGNCSVQGLDQDGGEPYWVVTGDNVRSLIVGDIDDDGLNELIVGSDDYDIRIFKNEDLIYEITETQVVTHLLNLGSGLFAYALANGTVGVYEKTQRLWRVKSKNCATCLNFYDIDADGQTELVTGWQGGKVDGRSIKTGEVLFKDNFPDTVAGIITGDYRGMDQNDVVVLSITGEIRGYNPTQRKPLVPNQLNIEQDTIRELFTRKHNLMLELRNYDRSLKVDLKEDAIPVRTRLQTSVGINIGNSREAPRVEISLTTNNDTIIRAVLVFAEGIFKGETFVVHPKSESVSNQINLPLYPPRDVPVDIHIKALVGYKNNFQYHVFELTRQLPRFSMYTIMEDPPLKAQSYVNVFLNERFQRVILWINRAFLLSNQIDVNNAVELKLHLISLRDGKELSFSMEGSGHLKISTDNMQLAGDIIQSLAHYLNITELKSFAHYPLEEESLVDLLSKITELDNVKRKLNLDLSDKSNLVRNLIIRIEDMRLLDEIKSMQRLYMELNDLNRELIASYEIRANNLNDLMQSYKDLNNLIQKSTRLRIGFSLNLTNKNNYSATQLIKAIRSGEV